MLKSYEKLEPEHCPRDGCMHCPEVWTTPIKKKLTTLPPAPPQKNSLKNKPVHYTWVSGSLSPKKELLHQLSHTELKLLTEILHTANTVNQASLSFRAFKGF